MISKKNITAIVGMGYVGLPLAVELSKKTNVIGFDIDKIRVNSLLKGIDVTEEVARHKILNSKKLKFSSNINDLIKCNTYIVTVPTPVDINNEPNLKPLLSATEMISNVLSKNNLVVYESTVFPGVTEEICGPILEKNSKLRVNKNLFLGYSPERINPGDKKRKLTNIVKIVSGSNNFALNKVSNIYASIIKAGIFKAESIKIAEAAKVIENTQRDLNIAFVNELSLIFKKLNLSTEKILQAAETKWNFIPFRPGLVGGHCIGVDPYYLTYKSKKIGYKPKIILGGRNLNDQMSKYIFNDIKNILEKKNKRLQQNQNKKILIMGLTFKENCPDTRNSKVIDLFNHFKNQKFNVQSFDPFSKNWSDNFKKQFNVINDLKNKTFDVVIIAVKHKAFINMKKKIQSLKKKNAFIYDLKYIFPEKPNIYRL
jgi:UDP-N-acetyl-D-galactosamine dehydrogenase